MSMPPPSSPAQGLPAAPDRCPHRLKDPSVVSPLRPRTPTASIGQGECHTTHLPSCLRCRLVIGKDLGQRARVTAGIRSRRSNLILITLYCFCSDPRRSLPSSSSLSWEGRRARRMTTRRRRDSGAEATSSRLGRTSRTRRLQRGGGQTASPLISSRTNPAPQWRLRCDEGRGDHRSNECLRINDGLNFSCRPKGPLTLNLGPPTECSTMSTPWTAPGPSTPSRSHNHMSAAGFCPRSSRHLSSPHLLPQ